MASITPNVDTLKSRQRDFIHELVNSNLGVPIKEIITLPRCNNNFIHFITFQSAFASDMKISGKPGCDSIISGTTQAVLRIANPDSMFNHTVKVENTVAVMQLMREALSSMAIIPRVYDWSKTGGPSGNGWILEQLMPGVNIEREFHRSLPQETQRHVLRQISEVLGAVQAFKLPATVSHFGGLAFDKDGDIVSGPFVVEPYTGPYPDMRSFYKNMLSAQVAEADRSRVAKGWYEAGLRERLDTFANTGLDGVLSKALTKDVQPSLIIGDIVIGNFLFHPTTYQLLGLVDFDCSHTGHPLHEFFFSSFSLSYYVLADDPEVTSALFNGFPTPLPPSIPPTSDEYRDDDTPQWSTMVMFEEELKRAGAARPSSIEGAEEISKVYSLLSEVCPFHFLMDRWIDKQSPEKLQKHMKEQGDKISKLLAEWDF